ncbi:TPA: hypothetical protein ACGO7F_000794 [Streptococcus suis]
MAVKVSQREIVVDTKAEFSEILAKLNDKREPSLSVQKRLQALKGVVISGRHC